MKLKSLIALLILSAAGSASAHDFSATIGANRIYFDITDKVKKTAAVTYEGSISDHKTPKLTGTLEIPAKVRHNNEIYEVRAISPKAFAGAKSLKGVVIPAGLERIGDFAFEGCDSLASVVFPGNRVNIGNGAFFRCPAIADITFGSDWKSIDLIPFRWSEALTSISIPAKAEKISAIKKLPRLAEINVDPNNATFASHGGSLYSKDGKTLLAVPRALTGTLVVEEGTSAVRPGALIDCEEINAIDFPASLQSVSFRETSRMKHLDRITMRAPEPVFTAYISGKTCFLFQLANPKTTIEVPAASMKAWTTALAPGEGEYSDTADGIAFEVSASEAPTKKNLKGVKKFKSGK